MRKRCHVLFEWPLICIALTSGLWSDPILDESVVVLKVEMFSDLFVCRPLVADFEVKSRIGLKSAEKSNKYREEGNRLFQAKINEIFLILSEIKKRM